MELLPTVEVPLSPLGFPLYLEISVAGGGPFFFTTTRSWGWTEEAKRGLIRAAIRDSMEYPFDYGEMFRALARVSREERWSNHFDSVERARRYVKAHVSCPVEVFTDTIVGIPSGCAVILPKDRKPLGALWKAGESKYAGVLQRARHFVAVTGDGW
jgi:hypothetical protein